GELVGRVCAETGRIAPVAGARRRFANEAAWHHRDGQSYPHASRLEREVTSRGHEENGVETQSRGEPSIPIRNRWMQSTMQSNARRTHYARSPAGCGIRPAVL